MPRVPYLKNSFLSSVIKIGKQSLRTSGAKSLSLRTHLWTTGGPDTCTSIQSS